jgi:cytochrome c2
LNTNAGTDIEAGRSLLVRFQCNRCHEGLGLPKVPQEKHCVSCHQAILQGSFTADSETLKTWQSHLQSLNAVPSLQAIGKRLQRHWIESFLLKPYDVRPGLPATMPRLPISAIQARQLAAALVPEERPERPNGDPGAGQVLFATLGCASCHAFTGATATTLQSSAVSLSTERLRTALLLAPDLRFTRDRFQPGALTDWLRAPSEQKPDTLMPSFGLSAAQAANLAAYLLGTPLGPLPTVPVPARLPLLSRRVGFDEVSERVFRRTCWHCHSTAAYAHGDGGPGNTGGFGFPGRGFNVTTYADLASGSLDDDGERRSVFAKLPDGTPRLVAVLLARQKETAGQPVEGLRGMPLGLPPLSPEQLQLVESWIAQGRPQ